MLFLFACVQSPVDGIDRPVHAETYADVPAQVSIRTPGHGSMVENPVTFTLDALAAPWLRLSADGWPLGEEWESSERLTHTYTFTGTGTPRVVLLEGLDHDGNVIATDTITIQVSDDADRDIDYFWQYDNAYDPGGTCGLTSAAMVVSNGERPDDLYVRYGKAQGQSPEGLEALYVSEGFDADSGRSGTREELKAMLDDGLPVAVHGFWTASGHIAVLVGYDSLGWIVNDPAGDFYLGYGSSRGERVRYPFGSQWDQKMSWDGDIWWSTVW